MSQEADSNRIGENNMANADARSKTERIEFLPGAMGERITTLRKRKKLTQAQVAEQLGISAERGNLENPRCGGQEVYLWREEQIFKAKDYDYHTGRIPF